MFISYPEALCGFQAPPGRWLAKFRWRIASGRHLFPFRTEQLSHSAPMVLGGQPPGRVGRRRFFCDSGPPRRGGPLSFPALAARHSSPNGLQPVLAECGEVDQQVDGVGQPSDECGLRRWIEHEFVRYGDLRTAPKICNEACRSCLDGASSGAPRPACTRVGRSAGADLLAYAEPHRARPRWGSASMAPGSPGQSMVTLVGLG
jgi:hypothetical protein